MFPASELSQRTKLQSAPVRLAGALRRGGVFFGGGAVSALSC